MLVFNFKKPCYAIWMKSTLLPFFIQSSHLFTYSRYVSLLTFYAILTRYFRLLLVTYSFHILAWTSIFKQILCK